MKMAMMGGGLPAGVDEVADPVVADNYVKVMSAPLCTEFKQRNRERRGGFGHEAAGEVVETGSCVQSVSVGDTVLVSGLGPVGLGAVAVALYRGARVIGLDPSAYRRDMAKQMGAGSVFDPMSADIKQTVLAVTGGMGPEKSVDSTGVQSAVQLILDLACRRGRVAFISGDEEYRSEEGLPMLAQVMARHHGFKCTVLFAIDPETGLVSSNVQTNIPGMHHLATADMVVMLIRFRELPDKDMKYFVDYVFSGKPLLALRTSTHAFQYSRNLNSPYAKYTCTSKEYDGGFGRQVLGDNMGGSSRPPCP